ncbi:MAG: hypothetical protein JWP09_938 [Candidatus Taylorbacteria bacterium]|nr:hypothetical protein [Candidatus Taylorbacteria bacterium]
MDQNKKQNQWLTFIGVILILAGIYGVARTSINVLAFDKYPQEGVYPALPFFQQPVYAPTPYYGREGDCIANNSIVYPTYDASGRPVVQTEAEKAEAQKNLDIQKQNCLDGVKESRDKAKINDISQSLLMLFLGAGVVAARKIFKQ